MEEPMIPATDNWENSELGDLKAAALRIGFHSLGVARAGETPHAHRFRDWVDQGMHAGMKWMESNKERRCDPTLTVDGAQSVIMVTLPYPDDPELPESAPKVARYARGRDYHKVMKPMLKQLCESVSQNGKWETWYCVDSSPILERDWAELSGLGWIGKNGLIIDEEIGSWFFLGGIVTNRPLPSTSAVMDRCGTCTRCLDACPTSAIIEPRSIDAGKCISYWTIEHRGEFPENTKLHGWLFGCDVCQEVCPWNQRPARLKPVIHPELKPAKSAETCKEVLDLDREGFLDIYAGTPVTRTGLEGLKRNAQKILQEENREEEPS